MLYEYLRKLYEGRVEDCTQTHYQFVDVGVWSWNGDKVDFACASEGEGPVLQALSALRLNASSSKNQAMLYFVTKLAVLSRMIGSVRHAIL